MFDPTLVHEWLDRTANTYPDKTAVICGDEAVSYQQLEHQSSRLADYLILSGLKPQERVIILLANSIETVISLYAILKAGGVFVILNSALKSDKLAYILDNCQARFLITHTSKGRGVLEALNKSCTLPKLIWIHPGDALPEALRQGSNPVSWRSLFELSIPPQIRPRLIDLDLAALIYTSGSTGQPKGVISTHRNMVSAARSIIRYLGNRPEDVLLCVLPLSFDYGLYQVIMTIMFGGTVILETSFVYLHDILTKISKHRITGFPIVPTIVAMLLNLQDLRAYDFSSLRYLSNTGAALPVEHIRRFRSLFPHITLFSMFGLTECKRVCYLPPAQIDIRPDSVGIAMPDCQTMILDEEDNPVEQGQVGQLVIRGTNVMAGYWNDAELTARTYRPGKPPCQHERWLYSGDYFKQDSEGYLYFLGRMDDMIKTRGERVSPKEIENILLRLEGIAEAAVIGIPDPILGQVPKA